LISRLADFCSGHLATLAALDADEFALFDVKLLFVRKHPFVEPAFTQGVVSAPLLTLPFLKLI